MGAIESVWYGGDEPHVTVKQDYDTKRRMNVERLEQRCGKASPTVEQHYEGCEGIGGYGVDGFDERSQGCINFAMDGGAP